MEYNAIIREFSGKSVKVIGHILLRDFQDECLKDWKIKYCSNSVDRLRVNIEDLCCGPTNPLQIYLPVENPFTIFVLNMFGKCEEVVVCKTDTVKILKWKIFQTTGSCHPSHQKLFINRNHREKELDDSRTLAYYKLWNGSSVFLKQTPQDLSSVKCKAINLEETFARVNSKTDCPPWAKYSAGLNLCGLCSNLDCTSRKSGVEVVIKMGYGAMRVILSRSNLFCPACNESLILPDKFLVACARSLIRYKRSEEDQVKTQLIESTESGGQFEEIFLGHPYLIEICTVEPWRSPYCCVKCDMKIIFKKDEYRIKCGHMYHKLCKPLRLWGKCKICK